MDVGRGRGPSVDAASSVPPKRVARREIDASEAPVRITIYFSNRQSAGPYFVKRPSRATLEPAAWLDHNAS